MNTEFLLKGFANCLSPLSWSVAARLTTLWSSRWFACCVFFCGRTCQPGGKFHLNIFLIRSSLELLPNIRRPLAKIVRCKKTCLSIDFCPGTYLSPRWKLTPKTGSEQTRLAVLRSLLRRARSRWGELWTSLQFWSLPRWTTLLRRALRWSASRFYPACAASCSGPTRAGSSSTRSTSTSIWTPCSGIHV